MDLSFGSGVGLAAFVFPLVMAGLSDWQSLRIPNWLTLLLAAGFPAVALLFGHDVGWLQHVAAGLAVLIGAAVLFALRVLGGGDVKLLAATALWTGLGQLPSFLELTALIGGGFALVVLMLRTPAVQATLLAVFSRVPHFAYAKAPIPYGIPIAVAGILMAPSLSFLA